MPTLNISPPLSSSSETYIVTSACTSGNPTFLSAGAGATINVNGGTTPLVYVIAGNLQTINANLSITPSTPGADTLFFVFAALDTTNGNPVAADLVCTSIQPIWAYTAPSVAAAGLSASNPQVWFDLSSNTTNTATVNSGSFAVSTQMILLGVAIITSAPAIRAVLCDPYRLPHYKRYQMFGDGSTVNSNALVTTTQTIVQGYSSFRAIGVDGGVLAPAQDSINNGSFMCSPCPIIITNSGSLGKAGTGVVGGAGTAASNGTVGSQGGYGGAGGAGGGGVANSSGAGGGRGLFGRSGNLLANGGAAVAAGATGTNGTATSLLDTGVGPFGTGQLFTYYLAGMGSSGGGGAGVAGSTGGTGGSGGGQLVVVAPSILLDTGCTITVAGAAGANGGGTQSAGGGGGGGGTCVIQAGFMINNGTLSAAGGAGGTHVGASVGDGGTGGAGLIKFVKMW